MFKFIRLKSYSSFFTVMIVYIILINVYIRSLGLMDDFNYTQLNFFNDGRSYFYFIDSDIKSGGFRPFLPIQITLNNIGYYLFSVKGYFIFNLFFLFLILELFYFTMKDFFNLNKFLYYFIFFSWPYASDLIIHPSLQEKIIILAICIFLISIKNNKELTSRFSVLCIPLVKIQSLIFFPFVYSVIKKYKNKKNLIYYFLISSFVVLFVFFNQPTSYFNSRQDFTSIIKQTFLSPVNSLNLMLIIIAIYLSIKVHLKNKNILLGLALSNSLLIIFMSAYRDVGNYLNSLNIFFIVIYVLIIYDYLFKVFTSKKFQTFINLNHILIFVLVTVSFVIPRFERMNSIDSIMNHPTEDKSEIYYSCLEGVQYLNNFQKNNLFVHLENFQAVEDKNFLFLSDHFECNNVENIIIQKCDNNRVANFKYKNYMRIKEYQC